MGYIYLNFKDLNDEVQENWRDFDTILFERAESKLHSLDIIFNI